MKTKDLIVVSVGPLRESKLEEYPFKFIVLKSTDETDKTKYKLNLRQTYIEKYNRLVSVVKPGAVIHFTMQDRNPNNVDMMKDFRVIKFADQKQEKEEEPKQQSALQLVIGLELNNIEQSVNKIKEAIKG